MNGPNTPSTQRPAPPVCATGLALAWMVGAVSCAAAPAARPGQGPGPLSDLEVVERKVCLTIGRRTYSAADRCVARADRPTYIQPVLDVYRAAPPIMRAYLCSLDRIYLDSEPIWNGDFRIMIDPQTRREYRTIGVRRGVLERKVGYSAWASGWTQLWTGGPIDRPSREAALPRVESDLQRPSDVLFHLLAHEVAHLLAYDYNAELRREQAPGAFEPGDFGLLIWISPGDSDSMGWHSAVARPASPRSSPPGGRRTTGRSRLR